MGGKSARPRSSYGLRPLSICILVGVLALQACSKPPPDPHLPPLPSIITPVTPPAPPPPPPGPPDVAMANLAVHHHCFCMGPRDQFQTKIQLSITNVSQVPLNASIGNMRILVAGDMPGPWTAKDPAAQESHVTLYGRSYTAIPPNGNRSWEPDYGTFASHWYAGTLAPHETYSGEGKDNADLVFYIPLGPGGQGTLDGVALVTNDGMTVLGWQPVSSWPEQIDDPRTF
jgi:hypothetical protein